jgi:pimeloyl-ACP methyl ester carboxylesterase
MPTVLGQYYEESGTGPALLLLHGHTLDGRMWRHHLPTLTTRYRVINIDLPGHGQSGPAPDDRAWCHLVADLLDHIGLPQAALCGFSLGGALAISFALHYPQRCTALVPVDAALFGHPFVTWPGNRPYVKQARMEGLTPALEAWLVDPLFAPAMASPAAERIRQIIRAYPGTEWLTRQPPPFAPGPSDAERLVEIQSPTLAMVGEHDQPDFQAIADRLVQSIPGARKAVIAGSGHMSPLEQPERFRELLLTFLNEHLGE